MIRIVSSGEYFRSFGRWTADVNQAFDFEEQERARRIITELKLGGGEVVVLDEPEPAGGGEAIAGPEASA